jgi:hypothetical protein
MRRFVRTVDQLPSWQFVVAGLLVLASVKAWWMAGQVARNPGAVELGGMLLLAGSIVLSIFAIRRRQTGVWDAAAQVLVVLAGANLLSYFLLIPFLPPGSTGEVARLVRGGLGESLVGIGLAIPAQAGGLWLSRRFGTHSGVTERRAPGSRDAAAGAPDAEIGIAPSPGGPPGA